MVILSILTRPPQPGFLIPSSPSNLFLGTVTRLREDLQTAEALDSLHERYKKPIFEGLALLERMGLRAEARVLYEFAHGYLVEGQRFALALAVDRVVEHLKNDSTEIPVSPPRGRPWDPDWDAERPWFAAWLRQSSQIENIPELALRVRELAELLASADEMPLGSGLGREESVKAVFREATKLTEKLENLIDRRRAEFHEHEMVFLDDPEDRRLLGGARSFFSELEKRRKYHFIRSSAYPSFRQKYSAGEKTALTAYRSLPAVRYAAAIESFLEPLRRKEFFSRYFSYLLFIPASLLMFFATPIVLFSILWGEVLATFYDRARSSTSKVGRLEALAEKGSAGAIRRLFLMAEGGNAEARGVLAGLASFPRRSDRLEEGHYERDYFQKYYRLVQEYGNWRALAELNRNRREFAVVDDLLSAVSPDNPILIASVAAGRREALEALEDAAYYYPNIREIVKSAQLKGRVRVRVPTERTGQDPAAKTDDGAEEIAAIEEAEEEDRRNRS